MKLKLQPGQISRKRCRALTARQQEIMRWIKEGKTNWEIAQILEVEESTVRFHVQAVFKKLDVHTRGQAIAVALEWGLLTER